MGIIREEDRQARAEHLEREDRRNNPVKYAMIELEKRIDLVIHELVESARKHFVEHGTVMAVTSLHFGESSDLVNCAAAEELIARRMFEVDPSRKATVKIGPDCSGNYSYAAEVVVKFDPSH